MVQARGGAIGLASDSEAAVCTAKAEDADIGFEEW
jgi:hypothetical protein